MTFGGPGRASTLIGWDIYSTAFMHFNFGVATAEGIILALITIGLAILYYKKLYQRIEYVAGK